MVTCLTAPVLPSGRPVRAGAGRAARARTVHAPDAALSGVPASFSTGAAFADLSTSLPRRGYLVCLGSGCMLAYDTDRQAPPTMFSMSGVGRPASKQVENGRR